MSKFYVGQRVRIVNAANRDLEGVECFVLAIGDTGIDSETGAHFIGYRISALHPLNNQHCCAYEWQLEPLTDPGREVVSWEKCEWKPPHLREVAA